ncbi:dolichyl-phosphate-mannose-protein mannosyltransferase [Novosphingobium sp. PhB165]|uniref:glycosyl transferase n=1 Tax=Novosphingobium sp. PhB165 TaxID=2485105 RepID=UPI00104EA40A|nr:glycosyl transferase [Novosphingobium sp. PhB165]TCM18651.1 dolichyl-phosphate-mannose-protein mannosyltransferase [Novosphingobium sp. PhB165]
MSAQILDFPTRPSRLALRLEWFATERSVLLAIWALYFALRVAVLFVDVTPSSDAQWYALRAAGMASGAGYLSDLGQPTAFWPPGWPLALGFAFSQFGVSPVTLGIFNLVSALLIGLLTLALGRRLFASEGAARLGLLLLAIYPNAIAYVPLALTEVFYTLLLMAACWAVVARENRLQLIGAGLVFGFATLVKAQTLVAVPLIFLVDWLRMKPMGKRLPGLVVDAMVVLAAAALVVAPWAVRNRVQMGHWIAISTNDGYTLLTGNHDGANGDYSPNAPVVKALMARTDLDETARDAEARRLAFGWIADHPHEFLALAPQKLARLWLPDGEAEWAYQAGAPSYARLPAVYRALRWVNQGYYLLLMLGFALAFVVMTVRRLYDRTRWAGWWLLPYALALYPTAICLVFSGQSRFHYPVMPFVCMAAGWLVVASLERLAWRRRKVTLH